MSKKGRTPAPPRRVQAPRPRSDRAQRSLANRSLLVFGVAILVAGAVAGIVLSRGGAGNSQDLEGTLGAAGCSLQTFADQGRRHAASKPADLAYNSFPPTSGTHDPRPAIWGAYDSPVPEFSLVHNLEHGGLIVQYGSQVGTATVAQIVAWWKDDPNGIVVAPLPQLRDRITLSAWTHLARCTRFTGSAFDAFSEAYRFRGPERFPSGALAPGT